MKITNKQIQAIQDEMAVVKEMLNKLTKDVTPGQMTMIQLSRFSYWDGRSESLEKVIKILGL